jgi:RNA polymerase sigma-70 factor (ECF subfamily)
MILQDGCYIPATLDIFLALFLGFFETVFAHCAFIMAMTVEINKKRIPRYTSLSLGLNENEHTGLIQRACSDPDAFAELYLLHYKDVFYYCIRRLFDRHSAEDVTSTVFFKVMHNLDSFNGRATDFRSWLFRIATNAVNDHLRTAKRRADVVEKAVINTRAKSVFVIDCDEELLEKKALLKQALLSLKPKYQTVITLRFFENMKLTEIAGCLGKKPSTVRSWLQRANVKLRKKLDASMKERGAEL